MYQFFKKWFRYKAPAPVGAAPMEDKKAAMQCGTLVDSSKPVPSFSLHCSTRLLELSKALFLSRWPGEDNQATPTPLARVYRQRMRGGSWPKVFILSFYLYLVIL